MQIVFKQQDDINDIPNIVKSDNQKVTESFNYFVREIKGRTINNFESHDFYNFIALDMIDKASLTCDNDNLYIYHSRDILIFVFSNQTSLDLYENALRSHFHDPTSTLRTLYAFFDLLIKDDPTILSKIEEQITDLENDVITSDDKEVFSSIIPLRKKLLSLKQYYQRLNSIFEGIMDNENDLIRDEELRFIKTLDTKIDRLSDSVVHLRDYITQVREAYQAQVDITMNKLMKTFTVITAIFSPLSIIVGWYGMNLVMPEFSWSFGYPMVIILTIAIVTGAFIWFKRNRWI